jgi:hypothetical protein
MQTNDGNGMRVRKVVCLLAAATMLAALTVACGPDPAPVPPDSINLAARVAPRTAFYYQPIPDVSSLRAAVGAVDLLVVNEQPGAAAEQQAAQTIHSLGAAAYHYANFYWFPNDRAYEGIDIRAHPDWAFCTSGSQGDVGKVTHTGTSWLYLDTNERAARNAATTYLRSIKNWGYDGVTFDRGMVSLLGGLDPHGVNLSQTVSTCTNDPVSPQRRFADAFVALLGQAKAIGLKVMLNYGANAFNPSVPLRPSSWCTPVPGCPTNPDVWSSVDWVINESGLAAPDGSDSQWLDEWSANRAAENDPAAIKNSKVVNLLKEGGSGASQKQRVYFRWASNRLANLPVVVNTGDDHCGGSLAPGVVCMRNGLFPELDSVQLGRPMGTQSQPMDCVTFINCLQVRRYEQGMVLVNLKWTDEYMPGLPLGASSCRTVHDLWSNADLGGCNKSVNLIIPARSGRVLSYH